MSARPNLLVRALARLLRPVVIEVLEMGGRETPLPWPGRPRPFWESSEPEPRLAAAPPPMVEIDGGGALFAGQRFEDLPGVSQHYIAGLQSIGAAARDRSRRHG